MTMTDDKTPSRLGYRTATRSVLHDLLLRCTPANARGQRTLTNLAQEMRVSRFSVNKWVRNDRIPASRLKALLRLAAQAEPDETKRPTKDDLEAFVYID